MLYKLCTTQIMFYSNKEKTEMLSSYTAKAKNIRAALRFEIIY